MNRTRLALLLLSTLSLLAGANAQITPSADAYTNTADPTTNYGAATLLDVDGATQKTYIQFNLSSIPSGATISQATLKLYVNAVTKAGSFNVDYVNGTWAEGTITANLAPALGAAIVSNVSITTADKNQYILVNVTPAVAAWLNGSEANDGLALVANSTFNASFDSKENTTTSHPPELDIVFAGSGGGGIAGITTASGSGLMGGGTSGTLNLSLTNTCAANQVLEWSGTAWLCATLKGNGTITGVTAGTDLTGGGTTGKVTLNLDTTQVPQLAAANTFTANQTVNGNVTSTGTITASALSASSETLAYGLSITSAANNPLYVATSSSTDATAIYGVATSPTGVAFGVEGVTASSGTAYGVVGDATATSGSPYGVYGIAHSSNGVGVFGQSIAESKTGAGYAGDSAGTWGDGGTGANGNEFGLQLGVLGTIDDGSAGFFVNNSPTGLFALVAESNNSAAGPFLAQGPGGHCVIDANGNLNCTGAKHALVPIDGGKRTVALSAIESPKNWFEDFGSAQLAGGSAVVALDPDFIQTVNTEMDYKVFPVPNGDCKGLYVTSKTATSFEVRELGGGTSSVHFDYRIVALRRKYENVRFADHTNDPGPRKMLKRMEGAGPHARPSAEPGTGPASTIPQVRPVVEPVAAQPK